MRKVVTTLLAITVTAISFSSVFATENKDNFWQTPTIHNYGKIHYLPNSAFKPDPTQQYHIVFGLTAAADKPDKVNPSLDHVARTVNLYVAAGVPLKNLHIEAVVYSHATPLVLQDAAYQKQYGVANPNLPLITELEKAGIHLSVCGQAIAEHHFDYGWLDKRITLALSALTTITVLEHQGYTFMML